MKNEITERVNSIRAFLKEKGLSAFVIPSADPHSGEYIPSHWSSLKWISGFKGSAGTVVITANEAALWTDSRYFLAAEEQLKDTPFSLMKDRLPETPSIPEWLIKKLPSGSIVGLDGWVNTTAFVENIKAKLSPYRIAINAEYDPMKDLWTDRPSLPKHPIYLHPMKYAGQECQHKIEEIRIKIKASQANALIVSELDEIAWILNLRGNDVHCNPVFISYLLVTLEETILFIDKEKIDEEVAGYLKQKDIALFDYEDITSYFQQDKSIHVLMDPSETNFTLYTAIHNSCNVIRKESPVPIMKAIKNEAEIKGYKEAMLLDGIALVKFLKWLKPAVTTGGQTEISISNKLTELRAASPLYKGLSFDTIAGYKHHGAIVHYQATPQTDCVLYPQGMLLIDSGAQYLEGTTDITRTIALGPLTDEEKKDYTLVLKGHIDLARVKFPEGTTGTQLDICARYAMWQEGLNYLHGTGHGVGSFLNVHEGPHQLRMNYVPTPLCANMTLTNEPGLYKTGKHGCRTENLQLIIPYMQGEFGLFLQFEPLTLCPIDTEPILWDLLSTQEIQWLNNYHKMVYDKLAPLLDEEHREWLEEATKIHHI